MDENPATPSGFDYGATLPDGQHERHPTIPTDGAQMVRPIRHSYKHTTCGTVTRMPESIARTYAARPGYYGSTFCCGCGKYFPVGANGEFVWMDQSGQETTEKVGT